MIKNSLRLASNLLTLILLISPAFLLQACSDDNEPSARSEYDIVGIWQDSESHVLNIVDPDKLYEYEMESYDGVDYWLKRKEMYFFEPYSYLLMKADSSGTMQLYKVISVNTKELVLCWVTTPDTGIVEDSDDKFQIFSFFFKDDYTIDPANYVTYSKITENTLDKLVENGVLIEL